MTEPHKHSQTKYNSNSPYPQQNPQTTPGYCQTQLNVMERAERDVFTDGS